MKKISWLMLVVSMAILTAVPALAEDVESEKNTVPPGTTEYEFEDELLRGETRGPNGTVVVSPIRIRTKNLIKIRRQFVPEMLKTVETI